jgi:iron complex transport system substrate-binding protein
MRLRLVLLALLALPLAACGSEEDLPAGAAASGGAFPVTVQHKFGKTTVEKAPERVVTVGYTDQDAALAVGVVPVAVGDFLGGYDWRERPWAQDALGGAEPKVVAGQQINFEAVAAQRPDLIIAINAGLEQDDYDKLARIAPTVAQSGDYIDFGMPWDEQTMLVARALGREQRGEEVVGRVEAKFAQVREEHPEFAGKSGILAYGGPDGYGAYATGDTRSRFFTDLGFELPEQVDELAGESFFTEFSQEQFRLLDPRARRDVRLKGRRPGEPGRQAARRGQAGPDGLHRAHGPVRRRARLRERAQPRLAARQRGRCDRRRGRRRSLHGGSPARVTYRTPQRANPRDIAAMPSEIQPDATSSSRPAGTRARPSYQVSGSQMPSSMPSNGAEIGAEIR